VIEISGWLRCADRTHTGQMNQNNIVALNYFQTYGALPYCLWAAAGGRNLLLVVILTVKASVRILTEGGPRRPYNAVSGFCE
jgi:hypothetical protein